MNNCICGSKQVTSIEIPDGVLVDRKGISQKQAISLVKCESCGLVRQAKTPFENNNQYSEYYKNEYPPNKQDYIKKDYVHDLNVAQKRCNAYGSIASENLLDVGSGSGSFVDECRTRGINAHGCEIGNYAYAKNDEYIYHKQFENIHFPTDSFQYVTCHDVFEHVLNPIAFISEMFRVIKQNGYCIIEIPDFFSPDGKHHWKDIEHVWFFNRKQFIDLARKAGFEIEKIQNPIPGKIVFWLKKPKQSRVKILVPPGIGDSYWSIVKMQSFLEKEGLGLPDIAIAAGRDRKYSGHLRSIPFLKMFPFLNATSNFLPLKKMNEGRKIWHEAYAGDWEESTGTVKGRTVFRNIFEHDYLLSYNGHVRWGKRLEDIDPQYKCNWHPPMFVSLEQENYRKECIDKYGKYICFYLPFYGHYRNWTREFDINKITATINKLSIDNQMKPVLVGAQWDADDMPLTNAKKQINGLIDLTGKTTVDQVFGCLKGSQLVFGFPSGLTIMAASFGCKALLVWNDYFEIGIKGNRFYRYSCPPDIWEKNYFAMNTKTMSIDNVVKASMDIISGRTPDTCWPTTNLFQGEDWETGTAHPRLSEAIA
jgi:SAM-dependent methyltransferase